MPAHRIPLAIRFWAKVNKTPECWLWIGAQSGDGYGHIKVEGRMQKAHRVAYELAGKAIPEGLHLDHLCRTPLCVNPAHLEPVTQRENIIRGDGATARHSRKTHCKRNHEFTPENTYMWQTARICRTCRRDYVAQRRAA